MKSENFVCSSILKTELERTKTLIEYFLTIGVSKNDLLNPDFCINKAKPTIFNKFPIFKRSESLFSSSALINVQSLLNSYAFHMDLKW